MGRIFQPVRKRADGTKYLSPIFWIEYYDPAKGYSRIESSGSENHRDAERLLRNREKSKDDGRTIIVGAHKTMMRELFDLVIREKTNNQRKAVATEKKRIDKHLTPMFGNLRAVQISFDAIECYKRARIAANAANGTINRELALVRQAFRLGLRYGKVSHVPQITFLNEDNIRKGFFEEDAFFQLLTHLPIELKPLHIFDYFTGIRHEELLNILWHQVDQMNCVIRLEETKSGEPREIYYAESEDLRKVIERQWKMKCEIEAALGRKVEHLFFRYPGSGHGTKPGDPIKDFRGAFNNALAKAEITNYEYIKGGKRIVQKRVFHDFRRTAIRNLRRAGVDRSTIKIISGHETDAVFERYNIRDPRETKAALGKVKFELQIELQRQNSVDLNHLEAVTYRTRSRTEKQNPRKLLENQVRESGGIGRRAGLRIQSRKGWGFESPLSHSHFAQFGPRVSSVNQLRAQVRKSRPAGAGGALRQKA